ncbi:F-box/kelch-repeat protein At3g23880-like [Lycium ferocissimum]|uniref:F-box/kelch-repeat protein At3g23880-like n=1 Tax=Lycium ferocissimum TaxID=112874 RepID=UPI002814FF15|nr:F-box/kelch-repeat protein At3g23880-like [Lycium ferocissimum]
MDFEEDEAFYQHPKQSKPINHSQLPSTSIQDSILKIPILPVSANNKDHTHHRLVLSGVDAFYNLKDCSLRSLLSSDSVTEAFDLDYPMKNPTPKKIKFKKLFDARPIGTPVCSKYGFGYDESHHDYKVVLVMFYDCTYVSLDPVKVKIYSLKSDYWRTVVGDFQGGMRSTQAGKFANGKLHWATNDDDWNIISIDLADEKWGKVEQSCYGEGYSLLHLAVLRSDLSVCCNYMSSHTDVWVMKEYGVKESWIKMYTIKYLSDLENPYFSRLLPPTLCMSKKGEILLVIGSTLMIHNPEDESTRYTKVAEYLEIDFELQADLPSATYMLMLVMICSTCNEYPVIHGEVT